MTEATTTLINERQLVDILMEGDRDRAVLLSAWVADCVTRVLPLFERLRPHDERPGAAIALVRAWPRWVQAPSQKQVLWDGAVDAGLAATQLPEEEADSFLAARAAMLAAEAVWGFDRYLESGKRWHAQWAAGRIRSALGEAHLAVGYAKCKGLSRHEQQARWRGFWQAEKTWQYARLQAYLEGGSPPPFEPLFREA